MKKMLTVIVIAAAIAVGCNSQQEETVERDAPVEDTTGEWVEETTPQETTTIDESPVEETTEVVTETTVVAPVPPSVPPPPAKEELPRTGAGNSPCGHGQGDVGAFCNEGDAEAAWEAAGRPQATEKPAKQLEYEAKAKAWEERNR